MGLHQFVGGGTALRHNLLRFQLTGFTTILIEKKNNQLYENKQEIHLG